MIKQVIVIRKDLNMRKGKMCAQTAHASMKVLLDKMDFDTKTVKDENGKRDMPVIRHFLDDNTLLWLADKFTKIVASCDSKEELVYLYTKAKKAKLPCAIIEDSGQTEFKEVCPECEGDGIMNYEANSFMYKCRTCKGIRKINKPTLTAVAIGPAQEEDIDKITGYLKLL
ncbi:hypothetical protein LCGC14_1563640 [marine sediment metagenome]|uniref:peptidyl-tRNA hydrolase n=1 Tax=marine sediment metagenome TaxID=412755 RepID=A0A0F9LMD9_9ZZZZ